MRPPKYSDIPWITEAYADWHLIHGDHPPVTIEDVKKWVRRWIHRDDEVCLTDGKGLITYRIGPYNAVIDNLVVHPDHRGQGVGRALIQGVTEHLFEKGVLVASFKTLPGPIRDKYPEGRVTVID